MVAPPWAGETGRRIIASPAPQVHRVSGRLETGGLDHLGGDREALPHLIRLVGVAPVLHSLPAHLAPPAHDRDVRAEDVTAGRVHLQDAAGASAGDEDGADLLFVVLFAIRRRARDPVSLGVVEMREGLEGLAAVDHRPRLAEVLANGDREVETGAIAELARVEEVAFQPDAVDRPVHTV